MPDPADLTLGVKFIARKDANFDQILRRLHAIITQFGQGMEKVDSAVKKTSASMRQLESSTKRVDRGLKDTGTSADWTGKQISKVHGGIQRLIAAFKVVAVYTVAGRLFSGFQTALRQGWEEIVNFDQALANLKAITGATDTQIQSMRETLKETALRTKFSTTEIAEGMVLLGQAGLDAGESMKAIDAVADLAAGTLSDFRNVSDLVTTSLRAFNLDATETRRVADVMANAVNKSKLTIDKLRTAFNYVGAGAAQAGLSIEQTAASMMVLANNGMRASTIGTGLRQVLARLLSPNAKIKMAMDAYGLTLDKATGKQEWFSDQIQKLATVMYDFEKGTVNMSKAYELFGLRGAQAAAILVKSFMDLDGTWASMLDKVKELGTAQKMMEAQAEGLGFKIKNLGDSFGVLAINLGEAGFTSAVKLAVDALRGLVQYIAKNVNTTLGSFTATLIGVAGALYTVQLAVMALSKAWAIAGAGIKAFFLHPVGRLILILSAAISLIITASKAVERKRDAMAEAAEKSKTLAGNLQAYVSELDKVKEGSEEYNRILDRMKQQYKELAPVIEKLRGNYQALREEIVNLSVEERKRAIQTKSLLLTTDKDVMRNIEAWRKDVAQKQALAASGAVPSTLEQWLGYEVNAETKAKIEDYVQTVGEIFKQQIKEGKTRKEIDEQMAENGPFGFLSGMHLYPELVEKIMKDIRKIVDDYQAQIERQAKARADAMAEKIEALPKKWRDLLDEAWANQQYNRVMDILEAITQGYTKLTSREKEFERSFLERHKTMVGAEEAIAKLRSEFWDIHLAQFLTKGGKAVKKHLSDLDKIREWYISVIGTAYDVAAFKHEKYYKDQKRDIEANIKDNEEKNKMLLALWEDYLKGWQRLSDEYGYPGVVYDERKIRELVGGKAAKGGFDLGGFTVPKPEEIDWLKDIPPRLEQIHEWQEEIAADSEDYFDWLSDHKNDLYDMWKRGELALEAFLSDIERLKEMGEISEEEYERMKRLTTGTPWQNFVAGMKSALREGTETFNEFMETVGKQGIDKLASGFADLWGDFATGTKSMKEAFADFARDMLRWLAEITAKWLIMKALTGLFGTGHSGGVGPSEWGPRTRKVFAPFVPRLHDGLAPDEFPAILKKDEGVFTPKQMKALGAAIKGTGGTQITVPVTIGEGVNGDRLKRYLPGEIEEAVLKTMRRYM